jgi:hypothetical protein
MPQEQPCGKELSMEQSSVPKDFWLKWVTANAIAWLVGFGVLGNLVGITLLFGALFGAVIGIAQILSTENRVRPDRWLIANIVGWAVGSTVATVASRTRYVAFSGRSELVSYVLFGTIGGVCSAILEYFLQWQRTHRNYVWILVLGTSNAAAGLLSGCVVWAAVELALDLWILIAPGGWIAGGALFGAITVFPMIRLQRTLE